MVHDSYDGRRNIIYQSASFSTTLNDLERLNKLILVHESNGDLPMPNNAHNMLWEICLPVIRVICAQTLDFVTNLNNLIAH